MNPPKVQDALIRCRSIDRDGQNLLRLGTQTQATAFTIELSSSKLNKVKFTYVRHMIVKLPIVKQNSMIDMVELDQVLKSSSSLLLKGLDLMDVNGIESDDGNTFLSQKTAKTKGNGDRRKRRKHFGCREIGVLIDYYIQVTVWVAGSGAYKYSTCVAR